MKTEVLSGLFTAAVILLALELILLVASRSRMNLGRKLGYASGAMAITLIGAGNFVAGGAVNLVFGALVEIIALAYWNMTCYQLLGFRRLKLRHWPTVTAVMLFGGRDGRRLLRMIATIKDRKGIR